MYDRFKWTPASVRRNRLTAEYEPLQPFFLVALIGRAGCETFVDVGANIGAYSLFATLVPSVRRVIAFEADPRTVRELERNIALNDLAGRIEVESKAVSDTSGTLVFGSVGDLSGANSVLATSIHETALFRDQYTIDATTLDEALSASAAGPLAMKIDVEGHEPAVLDGGKGSLAANECVIQIECYGDGGAAIAQRLTDLNLHRITAIGPDHYFTNIDSLRDPLAVVAAYEDAARAMIAYYHREKPVAIERGDFRLEVAGSSAALARKVRRLIGHR